jgi:tripartite-type tricarboxylate transporter receptor subunit TctC
MKTLTRSAFMAMSLLLGASGTAYSQNYPAKAIRMVVPATPGGAADTLSRTVAQKLSEAWGWPVVVENKGGAAGIIGAEAAARSPNDGYTLMMGSAGGITIHPSLYPKLPYDPVKDFVPVVMVANSPLILVVHPSLPAKSVMELIQLAKQKPGEINFGSAGVGSTQQLSGELLKSMANIDMKHIPYKGSAPAYVDLMAGRISVMFENMLSMIPSVKEGTVRAIAVTGSNRSPTMPELPTVAESGVPGFSVVGWYGIVVPAGTDPAIVKKLNAEINRILKLPEVGARLSSLGAEPVGGTSEEFANRIRVDTAKWKKVIKDSDIHIE